MNTVLKINLHKESSSVKDRLSETLSKVTLTIVAGPVKRCVPAFVSEGGQGGRLRTGDAKQLAQPGGVTPGCGQVDGRTTP